MIVLAYLGGLIALGVLVYAGRFVWLAYSVHRVNRGVDERRALRRRYAARRPIEVALPPAGQHWVYSSPRFTGLVLRLVEEPDPDWVPAVAWRTVDTEDPETFYRLVRSWR